VNIDEQVRDAFEEAAAAAPDPGTVLAGLPARRRARRRRRLGVTAAAAVAVLAVTAPYTVVRSRAPGGTAPAAAPSAAPSAAVGQATPAGPALHWDLGWLPPGAVEITRQLGPGPATKEVRIWQIGAAAGRQVQLQLIAGTPDLTGTPIRVGDRDAWWGGDQLVIPVGPQRSVQVLVTGLPAGQIRPTAVRVAASLRPARGITVGPAPMRFTVLPPGFTDTHGLLVTGRAPNTWTAQLDDVRDTAQPNGTRIVAIRLHNTDDTDGWVQSWNRPSEQVRVAGRPGHFYQLTQTGAFPRHIAVLRTTLPDTHDDLAVLAYQNLAESPVTLTRDDLIRVAAGIRALPATYPWIGR
jgi:hypothetical protein